MNIWYAHHYAGSRLETSYGRPYYLAKFLNQKGHNCRVISASYHHLMRAPVNQISSVNSEEINGSKFTWLKTPKYSGNGVGRFLNMFAYAFRFRFTDLINKYQLEIPDAIIISSAHPFHIFAGIYWAKKYNAKLIFEVRDIWPLSLIQLLGISHYNPISLLFSWVEKVSYKKSDQVVSLLPNAENHMISKGLAQDKFNYIPNGIDKNTFSTSIKSSHSGYLSKLKKDGAFIFMYTGAHGVPNYMEPVIEAAAIIKSDKTSNIHFIMIGQGDQKELLIEMAAKNGLINVHFLDSIPRTEIPDTLKYADVVFIGGRNLPLYEYGVSPNKMFEYMVAAKPILMTISSPNNPVEISQAGTCLGSNAPLVIANEIIRYSNLPKENLRAMGEAGQKYVEKHHLYDVLAQQYLDVINK